MRMLTSMLRLVMNVNMQKATAPPTAGVFDRWHMDFLGPLKTAKDGQQYILLVVEFL